MERSVLVGILLGATIHVVAESQVPGGTALSGYVLTGEWLPVSGGTVSMQSFGSERQTTIDSTGRFRFDAVAPGLYDVQVDVPRLMAHRLKIAIASPGTLSLPPIRLSQPAFVRLRVLGPDGEPITWPRAFRDSFNVNGSRIRDRPGEWVPGGVDPDGTTTMGPLPRGVTVLASDTPPFARKRLRDVRVTGESPLVDAGTVRLEPGAVLNVQVVDGAGTPVPGHDVFVDDGVALSPLGFPPARTDERGRVTFDRLAPGRHALRARAIRPCNQGWPTVGRSVDIPRGGTIEKTLVIDGVLRLTTGGVPLGATSVSVTSTSAAPAPPAWLREPSILFLFQDRMRGLSAAAPCTGMTDSNGRVTLAAVPPGPARAAVRLPNSTWIRRLEVPADGREVSVQIPSGVLPARAKEAHTRAPVSGATFMWTSGGASVEATASATGEVLLEAVSAASGTLDVRSPNFRPVTVKLAGPPYVLQDITLERMAGMELRCQVVTEVGEPVAGAVVELEPHDRLEIAQLAVTDSDGRVRLTGLSAAPMRVRVWADGFATSIESKTGMFR